MGFELDQDDVANTFGVKITGKKAPVIPPPTGPKPGTAENDKDPTDDPLDNGEGITPDNPAQVTQLLNLHKGIAQMYKPNTDVR